MRIGCSRSLIVFTLVPVVVALGRSRLLYLSPPASTSGRSSEPDQTAAALSSSLLVKHRRTKGQTSRKVFRRPVYRLLRDTLWVGAIVSASRGQVGRPPGGCSNAFPRPALLGFLRCIPPYGPMLPVPPRQIHPVSCERPLQIHVCEA